MSAFAPTIVGIRQRYQRDWVSGSAINYLGCSDWRVARGASPTWPLSDQINSTAKAGEYFNGANAAFNANRVWVYIPLLTANFNRMTVGLYNNLGMDITVNVRLIMENENPVGVGIPASLGYIYVGGTAGTGITVATAAWQYIAIGAIGDNADANRLVTDWVGGGLLIDFTPASDPASGNLTMFSMRGGA